METFGGPNRHRETTGRETTAATTPPPAHTYPSHLSHFLFHPSSIAFIFSLPSSLVIPLLLLLSIHISPRWFYNGLESSTDFFVVAQDEQKQSQAFGACSIVERQEHSSYRLCNGIWQSKPQPQVLRKFYICMQRAYDDQDGPTVKRSEKDATPPLKKASASTVSDRPTTLGWVLTVICRLSSQ